MGFKGSKSGLKLGPVASYGENKSSGREVWGYGLGIFDLAGDNGALEYVGNGGLSMADSMYPHCFGFKGSEWGSKLGYQESEMQYLGEKVWG